MSTPSQYDPEKTNAWTRDLPPSSAAGMPMSAAALRYEALDTAARAVIAAGRPHECQVTTKRFSQPCPCPQCAAWDNLKSLIDHE